MSRSTAEALLRLERAAWVLDGPDGTRRCALDGAAPAAVLDALRSNDAAPQARPIFELLDYTIGFTLGRRIALAPGVLANTRKS